MAKAETIGATLRQRIAAEIMTLVRQQPRKMEPRPTIDELEKILNSETSDEVHIESDGSVSVRPTTTTVGAVADKVAALVEGENEAIRAALQSVVGHLLIAKIDLETGAPKSTTIATIEGGLQIARVAISRVEQPQ